MSHLREHLISAAEQVPGVTQSEVEELSRAYVIAARHHHGELRKSGDPYITHPVAVAQIVTAWGQSLLSMQAAVVHHVPVQLLVGEVSDQVITLVRQAQDLDRPRTGDDVRAVVSVFPHDALVLKLADRFHNAQTWHVVEPAKAALRAQETLNIYVPVARRLRIPGSVAEDLTTMSTRTLSLSPVLHRAAVGILPAAIRNRYRGEWLAELDHLSGNERRRFAAGLICSALVLRARRRP